jgi:hypothetical protein
MKFISELLQFAFSAICLGNGLLLLAIAFDKALRNRKEMLIIGGLCLADLSFGLGTLLTNIYRVAIILTGQQFSQSSAWSCMLMPQFFLAYIGAQWTAVIFLLNFYLLVAKQSRQHRDTVKVEMLGGT